jgi:phage-related protein
LTDLSGRWSVLDNPWSVKKQIWEIKIKRGLSHRIFYATVSGKEIVLLHAYLKKSQKAPEKTNERDFVARR